MRKSRNNTQKQNFAEYNLRIVEISEMHILKNKFKTCLGSKEHGINPMFNHSQRYQQMKRKHALKVIYIISHLAGCERHVPLHILKQPHHSGWRPAIYSAFPASEHLCIYYSQKTENICHYSFIV